jgi:hypothetical protein
MKMMKIWRNESWLTKAALAANQWRHQCRNGGINQPVIIGAGGESGISQHQ